MSKVSIEDVESILLKKIDSVKAKEIVAELNKVVAEEKEEKSDEPRSKSRFVVVEGEAPDDLFIVVLNDTVDSSVILEDLPKAVATHNSLPKNKKKKIASVRDAFAMLKPRTLKEVRFKRKNKLPVEKILVRLGESESAPLDDANKQ